MSSPLADMTITERYIGHKIFRFGPNQISLSSFAQIDGSA